MRYVYLLRSRSNPSVTYVGETTDLQDRLRRHSAGRVEATPRHVPWDCMVAIRFADDSRARAFERYLKSGSGRAFAKRHLW